MPIGALLPAGVIDGLVEPQLTQNTQREWFVAVNDGKMTVRQAEARDFASLLTDKIKVILGQAGLASTNT